jgi:hypothetical protein
MKPHQIYRLRSTLLCLLETSLAEEEVPLAHPLLGITTTRSETLWRLTVPGLSGAGWRSRHLSRAGALVCVGGNPRVTVPAVERPRASALRSHAFVLALPGCLHAQAVTYLLAGPPHPPPQHHCHLRLPLRWPRGSWGSSRRATSPS